MTNHGSNEKGAVEMAVSRLAAIVESSTDAIIGKDLNGIITSWNQGAEKIFGYTADEIVGTSILRIIPADRQEEENYILGRVRRGEKVDHYETLRQTKSGRLINISVTASPIKDAAGNIVGVSKIARDITELKAHQQEVLRVSRLYAALSQINQAIVWTRDRDELFEKICRVLVELGKFSLAWIGLPDAEAQRLLPVARWGDDNRYLSQVTIYADGRPERGGPMGAAIRDGKNYICNDIAQDPGSVPGHEAANRAGYRAAGAFPIRQCGAVCGAIFVFSGEIGFFREMEVSLLAEAATDVSFALDNLAQDAVRHQAELAMRAIEERYRALFDRSLDCVYLNDFAGNFLDANQAALDLLGYRREDIATLTFAALLSEDQLPLALKVTEEVKTTGQQKRPTEFRLRCKDGRQVHVETQSSLIYREGKPFAVQGIARDLTERKRAEESLLASERRLNAFFTHAPAGLVLLDEQLRFVQLNETVARINGLPIPDHLGKTVREVLPKLAPAVEPMLRKLLVTGVPVLNIEVSGETPGQPGSLRYWMESFFPVFGKEGRADGVGVIFVEITERKRAEESLRLLNSAVLQANESIVITDAQLDLPGPRIVFVNPAFTQMTGYSAEEVIGRTPRILQGPRTDRDVLRRLRKTLERGEVFEGETIQYRKDGTEYDQQWRIAPLRDNAGNITHFLSLQRDVTEQRNLEKQFRQAQKMEAFGQLAGGVAHDFNNILAIILLQAGLLKSQSNLSPPQIELAGEIEHSAERGANLTRQLLLFSSKQTMQAERLNLTEVVANIAKMLRRTLGEQFDLQLKFSKEPIVVQADAGMIDQILLNLTVNARDAMPKGGAITIETKAVAFDEAQAAQTPRARAGSFVCLSVTDTGSGIAPEDLPRIFEPFFTTKEVGKGTGLGLATVFGIVQQHQGWINVDTEVGRGTSFRIYLPRSVDTADTKSLAPTLASLSGGNETLLVVEDEALLRASIQMALSRLGYRVLEAATGQEAWEVWQKHAGEIQLLLTDMVLPGGMTGEELAHRLSAQNPRLKIVYTSGYRSEIVPRGVVLEEDVNLLTKPFQAHQLAQLIRKNLDLSN